MNTEVVGDETFELMTVDEFKKKYRPDGVGRMFINGELFAEIPEIICDFCNAEIKQPEGEPDKQVVICFPGYAICETCFKGVKERESNDV